VWQRINITFFAALGKVQVLGVLISVKLLAQDLWITGVVTTDQRTERYRKKPSTENAKIPWQCWKIEDYSLFGQSKICSQSHCVEVSDLYIKRPEFRAITLFHHHDNASAHQAQSIKRLKAREICCWVMTSSFFTVLCSQGCLALWRYRVFRIR